MFTIIIIIIIIFAYLEVDKRNSYKLGLYKYTRIAILVISVWCLRLTVSNAFEKWNAKTCT